jgi:TRAP-type C4-dicarboxylate transport system substrate-binding protein
MAILKSLTVLACSIFVLFPLLPPGLSNAQVIELKAACNQPIQHPLAQGQLHYLKEIEKRTNGKVKFNFFHTSTLVKSHQTHQALQSGLADVVLPLAIWAFERQYPVSRILQLPFIADSSLHGTLLYYRAYHEIPEVKKEYSDLKIIGLHMGDVANIGFVGPAAQNLEMMKGKRIFTGSAASVDMMNLWGATARTGKMEEVFMSLQTGGLDGALFPITPAFHLKLTEAMKNWTIIDAGGTCVPLAMSLKTWQSLPPDVQKEIEGLMPSVSRFCGTITTKERSWVNEEVKKKGGQLYSLPKEEREKWEKAVQPLFDGWAADVKKIGIDGQAVLKKVKALAEEVRQELQKSPVKPDDWWGKAG